MHDACYDSHNGLAIKSDLLYSRKYWRSLNLAVWSRAAEIKILANLNLAVQYGIIIMYIRIYTEILANSNLAVVARTAKFSGYTVSRVD